MATKEERFKAQEIEQEIKQRQRDEQAAIDDLKNKAHQAQKDAEDKKKKARLKLLRASNKNMNQLLRVDKLRDAAKLGSEASDLKHKAKDIEKEIHKKEQDVKFELKQMQDEANRLKI